jgi:hypothetical protein
LIGLPRELRHNMLGGYTRATNVRLVDGEKTQTDAEPGMYAEPDIDSALAEGLRKLMSRGQEPQQ